MSGLRGLFIPSWHQQHQGGQQQKTNQTQEPSESALIRSKRRNTMKQIRLINRFFIAGILSLMAIAFVASNFSSHTSPVQIVAEDDGKGITGG